MPTSTILLIIVIVVCFLKFSGDQSDVGCEPCELCDTKTHGCMPLRMRLMILGGIQLGKVKRSRFVYMCVIFVPIVRD